MRIIVFLIILNEFLSCNQYNIDLKSNLNKKIDTLSLSESKPEEDNSKNYHPFHPKYSFASFPVKIYEGKLREPDFTTVSFGNDPHFKSFIQKSIRGIGVNFAGQFTIAIKSCGAMCQALFIIDRKTGKIYYSFPQIADGRWGYKFYPDSRLLIANAEVIDDSLNRYSKVWGVQPELYKWNGKKLKRLE